jgi:tetratricopeptide (TPR) repeat protein
LRPPWQRLLQGADAQKAAELDGRVMAARQAGMWEEALRAAGELLALRQKVQGKDHWEAVNAHWQVDAFRAAQRQGKEVQQEYAGLPPLDREGTALEAQGRYREAQMRRQKALDVRRKVLGEEHPHTAASLNNLAFTLWAQGQHAAAEEGFRKALAVQRKVLGEEHPDTAQSHDNLGHTLNSQAQYAAAEEAYGKALDIRRMVRGEVHPDTAQSFNNLALSLHHQGRYAAAGEGFRQALEIYRKVLGEEHPYTAASCNNLATNLNVQGQYAAAEERFRQALAIHRKVFGEEHPHTALSYGNLASNIQLQGRYVEAEEGYRKALGIRRKVLGEEHPDTARGYDNLAVNLQVQGKYAAAEEGCRKALTIRRQVLGEEHPDTAQSHNTLADNLQAQGQYAAAEEVYRKALEINRKVFGEEHSNTSRGFNNLAMNLQAQGKYAAAEEGFRKALDIDRKVFGEEHPYTAAAYHNVAFNLHAQGQYAAAEEGFRKALAIRRKVLGEEHPDTATCYHNLARNLRAQGQYAAAAEGFHKALDVFRHFLGEEHPYTATGYHNLVLNLHAQGNYREVEKLWLRAAASFARARARLAHSGLERATITGENTPLPLLAAVLARNGKPVLAWQRFEESLARGTWDDLSARLRRPPAEQARQVALLARLARLDQLIEKAVAVKGETPPQKQQREDLLGQRRKAQEELDAFVAHLEQTYGPAAGQVLDLSRLQAALADDTALLGWIDLKPIGPKAADPNGEHWAFLLRSRGDPLCVRLSGSGDGGAWTAEDTSLPADLLAALRERRPGWERLAEQLHRQRLAPLAKPLGAGDGLPAVRRLLVLPSAVLAGLPVELFAADLTVSYALSGTLHAYLHGLPRPTSQGLLALADPAFDLPARRDEPTPPLPERGVLLTAVLPGSNAARARLRPGDVLLRYHDADLQGPADFKPLPADAAKEVAVTAWRDGKTFETRLPAGKLGVVLAQEPAPQALAQQREQDRRLAALREEKWLRLPGTRTEAEALQRLFDGAKEKSEVLLGTQASEQRLDELARSGALAKYRYVHLATHGEVDHSWPLRSAVLLARDQLPDAAQQLEAGLPVYDARLSAEEVLRAWTLHSELVTLSACQSALGRYERGEGFVGFAQAFLLCGSRSVCLSLWPVDDAATALLMHRFYANLLGQRQGMKAPLGKAAALAEAKTWLRNLDGEEALALSASLRQGLVRKKDAAAPGGGEKTTFARGSKPYAHPYYWSAFVLIGDPE